MPAKSPRALRVKQRSRKARGTLVAVRLNKAEIAPLRKVVADGLIYDASAALRIAIRYLPTVIALDLVEDNLRETRERVRQLATELGIMTLTPEQYAELGTGHAERLRL